MAVYSPTPTTLCCGSGQRLRSLPLNPTLRPCGATSAPVARKARLRTSSRSVTSAKSQRHRLPRVVSPPVSVISVADPSGAQLSQDTACESIHPFPWLLLPAAALVLLSKVVDGKGILLACCWLACHMAPWPLGLLTASAVTFKLNVLLSALLFALAPIAGLLAVISGGLPGLIPAQHLVNLTVRYPYFQGKVSIPRICAAWIQQHQGVSAYVNTMLAWGPWVLVSLAVTLQCAVWLDRLMQSKAPLRLCTTSRIALQKPANPFGFASMVTPPDREEAMDTSSAVRGLYPATESIASHANDVTRVQFPFNSRVAVQPQPAPLGHEPEQLQTLHIIQSVAPMAADVSQHKLASQTNNKASLGDRDLIAETKFDSQAAAAFQDRLAAATAQLHAWTHQGPEQGSAKSYKQGYSRKSLRRTRGRRSSQDNSPSQFQHTPTSSLQQDAELAAGHSIEQSKAGRQETAAELALHFEETAEQLLPGSAAKVPAQQASHGPVVPHVDKYRASDQLPDQASDKDTDRPAGRLKVSDGVSDKASTCIAHPDWAVGWVAGGGYMPGSRKSSQAADKIDTALSKIQQLERELQAARAEIAVLAQGQADTSKQEESVAAPIKGPSAQDTSTATDKPELAHSQHATASSGTRAAPNAQPTGAQSADAVASAATTLESNAPAESTTGSVVPGTHTGSSDAEDTEVKVEYVDDMDVLGDWVSLQQARGVSSRENCEATREPGGLLAGDDGAVQVFVHKDLLH